MMRIWSWEYLIKKIELLFIYFLFVIHVYMNCYKLLDWVDLNKLDWERLSLNENAIHLLEQNPDKINWDILSINPNAIHLLEQNQDKIDWSELSINPSIFIYDYVALKNRMKNTIAEDLMKNRFHPKNMSKWYGWGQIDDEDLELGVFN